MNTPLYITHFYFSLLLRIIVTVVILFTFPIPLFYKIILIMMSDFLDHGIPRRIYSNWISGKTLTYQINDKITDTITYIILLCYILTTSNITITQKKILITLLIFRIIGTVLFILKKDKKYLFYFPNFFLEISLSMVGINHFSLKNQASNIVILLVIIYKIIQEYILHYKNL